jgi:cold shock CspA family protein
MRGEYFYGRTRDASSSVKRVEKPPRPDRHGTPDTGRIVKLLTGQGHGFIRLADGTDVFFHRSDVLPGTSINDLRVGDLVTFERLEDRVSGARALFVRHV